ncbi:ComF family protein [bacterium]|nr:ComF family protein [bacterium]
MVEAPYCLRCSHMDSHLDETTFLCEECQRKSRERNPLSRVIAGADYSGKVPDLISGLKYSGLRYLAKPLARFITLHPEFPVLAPHIYALVPVPLHYLREFTRGFNQSEDLAYALGAETGIPVIKALKRTRFSRPQASLSMELRKANLSGAFRFRESSRSAFRDIRKNQLIALVDDVCTTGTTAELCARALKSAGFGNIILLCAAKT